MTLRIGVVTSHYPPATGGLEAAVSAQAGALAALGHQVQVFTQATRPGNSGSAGDGLVGVRRYRSVTGSDRYPVAPLLFPALRRAARRYDVIHAHHFHGAAAAAVLALPAGMPVVFTPHLHGGGHTAAARTLHLLYAPLGRRLFARADRVVCVSSAEADLVRSRYPEAANRIEVVRHGLEVRARPSAPAGGDGRPLLLSVGRLERYKRQDLLVRALAHLPGWDLAVVGDGPAGPYLKALAADLGLAERVHFPGRVTDDELGRWLARAWAFASMSEREAFGLTLLEMSAWGIPVVASAIPSHAEVARLVPDAIELVTPATDAAALAGSIARRAKPMTDIELSPWVGSMTWEKVGRSLGEIYQAVVDLAPVPSYDLDTRPALPVPQP